MDQKAATRIAAIEHATRNMRNAAGHHEAPPLAPRKPWNAHCSAMFRETMRQLAVRGGKPVSPLFTDEYADANELGKRIRRHSEHWIEVSLNDAQSLANQGALVVGSYVNPHPQRPGHLGFIYPVEVHRNEPLIRDANVHRDHKTGKVTAASSYGAVPAGKAFPLQTRWFRYRHY
jgi:hypothetical protein